MTRPEHNQDDETKSEDLNASKIIFTDNEGTIQLKRPLGPGIFCQDAHCKPNTLAFWTCDLELGVFQGCNKTVCDHHCRKISQANPIGWFGKSSSKIDVNRILAYSCGEPNCCKDMDSAYIQYYVVEEKKKKKFNVKKCMIMVLVLIIVFIIIIIVMKK